MLFKLDLTDAAFYDLISGSVFVVAANSRGNVTILRTFTSLLKEVHSFNIKDVIVEIQILENTAPDQIEIMLICFKGSIFKLTFIVGDENSSELTVSECNIFEKACSYVLRTPKQSFDLEAMLIELFKDVPNFVPYSQHSELKFVNNEKTRKCLEILGDYDLKPGGLLNQLKSKYSGILK